MKFKVGDKVRWGTDPDDRKWVGEVVGVFPAGTEAPDGICHPTHTYSYSMLKVVWSEESGFDWDYFEAETLDLVVVPQRITVRPKDRLWPVFRLEPMPDTSPHFRWQVTTQYGEEAYARVTYRAATHPIALQRLEEAVEDHYRRYILS